MLRAVVIALALAVPAFATTDCPTTVLREGWYQRLRPVRALLRRTGFSIRARSFDVAAFTEARAAYRELLEDEIIYDDMAAVESPEEKAALLVEALQAFFGNGITMPEDAELARRIFENVHFRDRPLGAQEAHRIFGELLALFPERNRSWNPLTWARQAVDDATRRPVDTAFLQSTDARDILAGLAELGVAAPESFDDTVVIAARGLRHWRPVMTALLTNSLLLSIGFPPVDIPNAQPIDFLSVPREVHDRLSEGELNQAYRAASERLRTWGRVHVALRGARKAFIGAIAGALVYLGATHYPVFQAWLAWATLSPAQVRQHEQGTYEPSAVVREQLQMWREALEREPTAEEVRQKLLELRDQERRGVLRVYPK